MHRGLRGLKEGEMKGRRGKREEEMRKEKRAKREEEKEGIKHMRMIFKWMMGERRRIMMNMMMILKKRQIGRREEMEFMKKRKVRHSQEGLERCNVCKTKTILKMIKSVINKTGKEGEGRIIRM
mmetsp:Transcript_29910/g.5401  ORF Transcript_29910/g.5401 Transcript_29910/m.5401 type:complete len:124 (-) Transcript_29910:24-395(-)